MMVVMEIVNVDCHRTPTELVNCRLPEDPNGGTPTVLLFATPSLLVGTC
jgi:hypothetical protein